MKCCFILQCSLLFPTVYVFSLDWNSAIVPDLDEKIAAKHDQLYAIFGDFLSKEHDNLFHSYNDMKEIVGDFDDVLDDDIQHHNYVEMTAFLKKLSLEYPDITHLHSIGKSAEGRDLWVIVVSDFPTKHEPGEPEFKYIANMHGNEVLGRETLLYLVEIFCKNYGKNPYLTTMVNTTRIHILPSMNPDGYEIAVPGDRSGYEGRANAFGIDLNRNFPPRFPAHKDQSAGSTIQPESLAIIAWNRAHPFVLSANFHGGVPLIDYSSLVANYPYDDSTSGQDGIYSPSTDNKQFLKLAYVYARAHSTMWKTGRRCGLSSDGDSFLNGITNGAGWYHLAGGMQDWNYEHSNCFEITIEMGCYKFPKRDMLEHLWNEHKFAHLAYIQEVHKGIAGFILDHKTGTGIANASIAVDGISKIIYSAKDGDFWRLLIPGKYSITASHPEYGRMKRSVNVDTGFATRINFTLSTEQIDVSALPAILDIPLSDNLTVYIDKLKRQMFACNSQLDSLQAMEHLAWPEQEPITVVHLGNQSSNASEKVHILIIAIDDQSEAVVRQFVVSFCNNITKQRFGTASYTIVQQNVLHVIPRISVQDLPMSQTIARLESLINWLEKTPIDVALILARSPPKSHIFSTDASIQKEFSAEQFDSSLKNALIAENECSNNVFKSSKLAALMESVVKSQTNVLEITVGIGCDINLTLANLDKKANGVLNAIVMSLTHATLQSRSSPSSSLSNFTSSQVTEFSTIPSMNPSDHFTVKTADKATSHGIDRLVSKCSDLVTKVDHFDNYVNLTGVVIGSKDRLVAGPWSLLMSIDSKTQPMLWQLANDLCDQRADEQVATILDQSTLVILPQIPNMKEKCRRFTAISSAHLQPIMMVLQSKFPQLSTAILFDSGGLNARYLVPNEDPLGTKLVNILNLANSYIDGHDNIQRDSHDMCNDRSNSPKSLTQIDNPWTTTADWRPMTALVVQLACCYEARGVGHLFRENRPAILSVLKNRLQGISGHIYTEYSFLIPAPVSMRIYRLDEGRKNSRYLGWTSVIRGKYFLPLPQGKYAIVASKNGYSSVRVNVEAKNGSIVVVNLTMPAHWLVFGLSRTFVTLALAFIVLFFLMWCLRCACRLSRKKSFSNHDKFERLPLADPDLVDPNSDDDVEESESMALNRTSTRFRTQHDGAPMTCVKNRGLAGNFTVRMTELASDSEDELFKTRS